MSKGWTFPIFGRIHSQARDTENIGKVKFTYYRAIKPTSGTG